MIVHEYGHLAGRLHVKSKRSIMFPHPNRFKSGGSASKIFQICIRAVY